MQINGSGRSLAHVQSMERIDLVYALSLAASLALTAAAMCVLLFAM